MRRDLLPSLSDSTFHRMAADAVAAMPRVAGEGGAGWATAVPGLATAFLEAQATAGATTRHRFAWLAAVAGHDVVLGKLFESHLDALQIADELLDAGPAAHLRQSLEAQAGLWAVWAAEGPPGTGLRIGTAADGGAPYTVIGRKSWCSGARHAAAALVTARDAQGRSCLLAVPMRHAGVTVTDEGWHAVGMAATDSVDVVFDAVPGVMVGAPGGYTARPGFWHGAAGIAACWHGAACAIARPVLERVRQRSADGAQADGLLAAHLGAIDGVLSAAALALADAARRIDVHRIGGPAFGQREALRVRGTVEAAAQEVLARTGRALGAAPLCRDAAHARRAADLPVFLRQSHAEWDLAVQGRLAAQAPDTTPGDDPWMP